MAAVLFVKWRCPGENRSGCPFLPEDCFHPPDPHITLKNTPMREKASVLKHCFLYITATTFVRNWRWFLQRWVCWLLISPLTHSWRLLIFSLQPVYTCEGRGQKTENPCLEIYVVLFPSSKQLRLQDIPGYRHQEVHWMQSGWPSSPDGMFP